MGTDESLTESQATKNIRRPVGVVPIFLLVNQPLRPRKDKVRTPVGFWGSAFGKDALDDIASKNFLKLTSNQIVFFRHLFFRWHPGSKDVVVGEKDVSAASE